MSDFDPVAAAAQLRQAIIDDAPKLFAENQRLRSLLETANNYGRNENAARIAAEEKVDALNLALENSGTRHEYTAPPGMVFVPEDFLAERDRLREEVAAANRPMLADDATKESFNTLADYVKRSTHWQGGGADRHDAKYALDVLSDSIEWTELGLAKWRDFGLKMAQQAAELRAEVATVRTLMDMYNVGGWTDAESAMKRALAAEAERDRLLELLEELRKWLGDEHWGRWSYMEGTGVHQDLAKWCATIDAALKEQK